MKGSFWREYVIIFGIEKVPNSSELLNIVNISLYGNPIFSIIEADFSSV